MLSKNTMILLLVGFIVIVAVIAFGGWHFLFGRANPPLPQAQVTIVDNASTTTTTTNTTMATVAATSSLGTDQLSIDSATFNVEIASTMVEQARGLSYRTSLGENDGMLFIFSSGSVQSFWMKDMNFPLDMIWISGNTVVGFAQDAPAEPGVAFPSQIYSSPSNTDKVLEVNAGTVTKYNIKVGDAVSIK
jgi:uncharacterized membrane protein (UPF0127 family)